MSKDSYPEKKKNCYSLLDIVIKGEGGPTRIQNCGLILLGLLLDIIEEMGGLTY